jgi:hypothetical protein
MMISAHSCGVLRRFCELDFGGKLESIRLRTSLELPMLRPALVFTLIFLMILPVSGSIITFDGQMEYSAAYSGDRHTHTKDAPDRNVDGTLSEGSSHNSGHNPFDHNHHPGLSMNPYLPALGWKFSMLREGLGRRCS